MVDRDEAALKGALQQARPGRRVIPGWSSDLARPQGTAPTLLPRVLEKAGQLDIFACKCGCVRRPADLVDGRPLGLIRPDAEP